MAHADTVRAPVTKKVISGIKGIIKKHPIGQLAGLGAAKKTQAVPSNELNCGCGQTPCVTYGTNDKKEADPIAGFLNGVTAKEDEYF